MGVFTAAPKSFKVDRKSYFASELKSLIYDHLLHFCPDYADDVLAEYITVLVCNGKNQHQARDDLEAFLGGMSKEFVSWLWHALLKYEPSLSACISSDGTDKTSYNPRDTSKETDNKHRKSRGLQSQGNSESDNLMGKDGEETYCLSAKVRKSQDMLSVDHHSSHLKERMSRTSPSSGPRSKSADIDSSTKVVSSLGKHQTRSVDDLEEAERPLSLLGRHRGSFPQSGTVSSTRPSHGSTLSGHPRKHWTETVLERSISPLTLVASSHDNKPRQSVWDRLGKPLEDAPSKGQTAEFYAMDKTCINKERISHRPLVTHKHGEQIVQLSTSCPTRTARRSNSMGYVYHIVGNAGADKITYSKGPSNVVKTIPQVASVSNIRRKRHFGDLSSQMDDDVAPEVVLRARRRPEVPSEASQVVLQVNDVKRRLRQVEIEMTKLRSKQVEMEKDGDTKLLNHGVVKATEEDNRRTIFVTNVHYKATKEALSMHFGKCGAVVDVVMLTDTNKPFAAQRSAYITFESKESADKALGFSGTTFYSRTMMVTRKGESAGVSSAQFAGKTIQVAAPHPKNSVTPEKSSFPGSHLQWRRESLTSTHSESPASTSAQMRAPGFASQQKLSGTSFSEKCGDSNQCPSALPEKSGEARELTC